MIPHRKQHRRGVVEIQIRPNGDAFVQRFNLIVKGGAILHQFFVQLVKIGGEVLVGPPK